MATLFWLVLSLLVSAGIVVWFYRHTKSEEEIEDELVSHVVNQLKYDTKDQEEA